MTDRSHCHHNGNARVKGAESIARILSFAGLRCIRVLLQPLLLGTVVALGVAWTCAIVIDAGLGTCDEAVAREPAGAHVTKVWRCHGAIVTMSAWYRYADEEEPTPLSPSDIVPSWAVANWGPTQRYLDAKPVDKYYTNEWVWIDARGWPLPILFSEVIVGGRSKSITSGLATTLEPSTYLGYYEMPRVLPTRPIWSNMFWSVAFYGAWLWIGCRIVGLGRRQSRAWRGLCPSCGYNLRGETASRCPECGTGGRSRCEALKSSVGDGMERCL